MGRKRFGNNNSVHYTYPILSLENPFAMFWWFDLCCVVSLGNTRDYPGQSLWQTQQNLFWRGDYWLYNSTDESNRWIDYRPWRKQVLVHDDIHPRGVHVEAIVVFIVEIVEARQLLQNVKQQHRYQLLRSFRSCCQNYFWEMMSIAFRAHGNLDDTGDARKLAWLNSEGWLRASSYGQISVSSTKLCSATVCRVRPWLSVRASHGAVYHEAGAERDDLLQCRTSYTSNKCQFHACMQQYFFSSSSGKNVEQFSVICGRVWPDILEGKENWHWSIHDVFPLSILNDHPNIQWYV